MDERDGSASDRHSADGALSSSSHVEQADIATPRRGGATLEAEHQPTSYEKRSLKVQRLILLVTAVYSFVSILQWHEVKRSTDLAKDALSMNQEAQRPWLKVDGVESSGSIADGVPFRVKIVNVGHTPARWVFSMWGLRVLRGDLPEHPPYDATDDNVPKSLMTLFPNDDVLATFRSEPIPASEIQQLDGSGKAYLYFYGFVGYWDAFDLPRGLTWCTRAEVPTTMGYQCPSYNFGY